VLLVIYLPVLWLDSDTAAGGPFRRVGGWRLSRLVLPTVQIYRHDLGGFLQAWAISLSIHLRSVSAVVLITRIIGLDAL